MFWFASQSTHSKQRDYVGWWWPVALALTQGFVSNSMLSLNGSMFAFITRSLGCALTMER